MIDLNKLNEQFEILFSNETEETFSIWLNDKKEREVELIKEMLTTDSV